MSREDILSKIRKLLDRAEAGSGSTEAEMEAAMALARKLMVEHNIAMHEAESSGSRRDMYETKACATYDKGIPIHAEYVMRLIERRFFVRVIIRGGTRVMFFGTPENIETGRYVYNFLGVTFRKLWNITSKAKAWPINNQALYYKGLADGLEAKLKESDPKDTGSVNAIQRVDTEILDAFREAYPNLGNHFAPDERGSQHSYSQGVTDGRSISIAKQVGTTRQQRAIGNG